MKLKVGVDLRGVKPEIVVAMMVCEPIISKHAEFVVTSVCDGKHMHGSKHYEGLAMDIRTREIPASMLKPCLEELKEALGPQYDVVLEGDHIHLEHDVS